MQKQVSLSIDVASWTNSSAAYRHPYPTTFPSGNVTQVDFLASLLQIGTLTVPWRAAACSLAAYWAYIRYCAAVDLRNPYLRLVKEWSDLDSHQKTILSDDWGVGFTTHWLASRLCFQTYCDGRYFIERLNGLGIATVNRQPKKRGPYKCPDFIFQDDKSKFHVIECKGNQQSTSFLKSQLNDGFVQKRSIVFSDEQGQVGQRIVGGFFAAESTSKETSCLALRDPEPDGLIVKIRNDADPEKVDDVVRRGDLARQFQLLGAQSVAAELLALPEKALKQQAFRRRSFAHAIDDLAARLERHSDNEWLTQTVHLPFPYPIESDNTRSVNFDYDGLPRHFCRRARHLGRSHPARSAPCRPEIRQHRNFCILQHFIELLTIYFQRFAYRRQRGFTVATPAVIGQMFCRNPVLLSALFAASNERHLALLVPVYNLGWYSLQAQQRSAIFFHLS
jgi:hypothetical protein